MGLRQGGHRTHGSKVNFSGRWFDVVSYGVRRDTELVGCDEVCDLALRHRPEMIVRGATAYPRLLGFPFAGSGPLMHAIAAEAIGPVRPGRDGRQGGKAMRVGGNDAQSQRDPV